MTSELISKANKLVSPQYDNNLGGMIKLNKTNYYNSGRKMKRELKISNTN